MIGYWTVPAHVFSFGMSINVPMSWLYPSHFDHRFLVELWEKRAKPSLDQGASNDAQLDLDIHTPWVNLVSHFIRNITSLCNVYVPLYIHHTDPINIMGGCIVGSIGI